MASGLNQIAANLFTLKYEKIPHKNIFIVGLLLIFFKSLYLDLNGYYLKVSLYGAKKKLRQLFKIWTGITSFNFSFKLFVLNRIE